jgi:hypothetical protein
LADKWVCWRKRCERYADHGQGHEQSNVISNGHNALMLWLALRCKPKHESIQPRSLLDMPGGRA